MFCNPLNLLFIFLFTVLLVLWCFLNEDNQRSCNWLNRTGLLGRFAQDKGVADGEKRGFMAYLFCRYFLSLTLSYTINCNTKIIFKLQYWNSDLWIESVANGVQVPYPPILTADYANTFFLAHISQKNIAVSISTTHPLPYFSNDSIFTT